MDDDMFKVSCLENVDKFQHVNKFRWPSRYDVKQYDRDELLLKLEEPMEINTKRLKYFVLNDDDFKDAGDVLRLVLK